MALGPRALRSVDQVRGYIYKKGRGHREGGALKFDRESRRGGRGEVCTRREALGRKEGGYKKEGKLKRKRLRLTSQQEGIIIVFTVYY